MPELVHYSEGRLITDGGQNIPDSALTPSGAYASLVKDNVFSGAQSGVFRDKGGQVFNALAYGVVADWRKVSDGVMTSGLPTLTSATAAFTAADVGKVVSVSGAGAAGVTMFSTIIAFVSATQVTLADNASTTVGAGVVNVATDNGPVINALIATMSAVNGTLYFPPGNYGIATTIRLKSNMNFYGAGTADNIGTVFRWVHVSDGTNAFDSDPLDNLAWFGMQDVQVISVYAVRPAGTGDGFALTSLTNNSFMRRVTARNMPGNGFSFGMKGGSSDHTAIGNGVIEQLFAIGNRGYGLKATAFVTAPLVMCDFNANGAGGFYFTGGTSNQAFIDIRAYWHEGSSAGSGTVAVTLDSMGGQACVLSGSIIRPGSGDIFLVTGSSAAKPIIAPGTARFGWTNDVNNTVGTAYTIPAASGSANYNADNLLALALTAWGPSAFLELFDPVAAGATNKRRGRWSTTSGLLVLSSRKDDGTSNGDVAYWDLSTFVFKPQKAVIEARVASTLAANGAVALTATAGNSFAVTLQANATSSSISAATTGQRITVTWRQDATGGRTYVWPTNCRFAGGSAPSDTTLNTATSVDFEYDGSLWIEKARAVAVPIT